MTYTELSARSVRRRHKRCNGASVRLRLYRHRTRHRTAFDMKPLEDFIAEIRRQIDRDRLGRLLRQAFPPDPPPSA